MKRRCLMSNIIQFPTNSDHLFNTGIELLAESRMNEGLDMLDKAFEAAVDMEQRVKIVTIVVEVCMSESLSHRMKDFWENHFDNKEDLLSHKEYHYPYLISISLTAKTSYEKISEYHLLKEYVDDPMFLSQIDFHIQKERELMRLISEIQQVDTSEAMAHFLDKYYDGSFNMGTQLLRTGDELAESEIKELFYIEFFKHEQISPLIKQMGLASISQSESFIKKHPTIDYYWVDDMKTVHLKQLVPLHEDPIFLEGFAILSHHFENNDPHLAMEAFELYEQYYSFVYPFAKEIIDGDIDKFVSLLINPEEMETNPFSSLMEYIELEFITLFPPFNSIY